MRKDWTTEYLYPGFIVLCLIALVVSIVRDKQNEAQIKLIMAGEVRGNKTTNIFHVPTCPQYDSINSGNLQTFETVGEAQEDGYRGSGNCEDAIDLRNRYEKYDPEPLEREDPRY